MSRRHNKSRKKARKERKTAYEQAVREFEEKYPLRGTIPGPLILNIMAQSMGRAYADARLREAKDPLKFDNILMEKRQQLWEEFKRHGNWRRGVDHLPPGWAKSNASKSSIEDPAADADD